MDKKILIGGGALIAGVIGFAIYRSKQRTVDTTASDAQMVGDIPSYANASFSTMGPISGGITSQQQADASTAQSTNTASGGGFDLGAMFSSLIGANSQHQSAQTIADAGTADSAILASIFGKANSSSLSVTHGANGTTISNGSSLAEQDVSNTFRELLGRDPKESGSAFYTNALVNIPGYGHANLVSDIKNSPEYKAKIAADQAAGKSGAGA